MNVQRAYLLRDPSAAPKKPSKYGNEKTQSADGIVHDSKAEAARWDVLCMLQRGGHVRKLRRQVSYELAPSVTHKGETRAKPALRYVADFVYEQILDAKGRPSNVGGAWCSVVEDVKGVRTDAFNIKRHLMKSVHGIDITLTKGK